MQITSTPPNIKTNKFMAITINNKIIIAGCQNIFWVSTKKVGSGLLPSRTFTKWLNDSAEVILVFSAMFTHQNVVKNAKQRQHQITMII